MADHNDLGDLGEDLAVSHLMKSGYSILDRNWRYGREEIDIIALKDNDLAIVEVKTRASDYFGNPEEFVSRKKQAHLIRAANAYVQRNDLDVEVRFDVVGIILNQDAQ
ncbi:MAG: YraN family protein [Flavobacteriales bacterium]|jgi:putative endonuclease|nr:YraN family protein [Flavobacteriales bacterium]NCG29892.1 YraN family protein [Bacteroidota bacterium]MBT3962778.1 YraN family protein [Flavobacteriales bacterium]MBT4704557.1 YraN family protein [Flavobacteriales bacterium]MBT4929539.1 YraN family protein [Flavobacteriales bacterium]